MKRLVSVTVVIAIVMTMLSSFVTVSYAAASLLTDGGFETSTLSDANSWKFTGGSDWYSYGNGAITTDKAAEGTKSVVFSSGVIGQRVSLETGKKYNLTAQIYTTAETTVKMGFHDGTKNYPNDNPVTREDKTLGKTNEWDTVSLDFECTKSQEYVICFYNDKKIQMYIDDVTLTEIKEEEPEEDTVERITVHNKKVENGQLTYNVTVSGGAQGTLTAAMYLDGNDTDTPDYTKTVKSTTELTTIAFSLPAGETSGRTVFTLTDSIDPSRSLSLPATDNWTTANPSSEITLNFSTYPLYVGNASTTNFTNWDGYGASIDLEATVTGASAENITWTVSDSDIVSMTPDTTNKAKVNVKARRTGYASVTATLPDGASASCYIPVIDNFNRFQMRRIVLNADTLTLAENGTAQLKAILYPKDALENNPVTVNKTLTWESSNEEVATVDESGNITAFAAGTAKITAKSADVGRTASCTVTVTDSAVGATGITAETNETVNMTVGGTQQLTANVTGDSAVYWKSENSYIADVDQTGLVTAYSNSNVQVVSEDGMDVSETAGTVKIYATTAEGGYVAEYNICVSDAPVAVHGVKINKDTLSIPNGTEANLTAIVTPSRILQPDVTWSSDNTSVVTVAAAEKTIYGASQATVTPVGTGTATVTATYGGKSDTCTVTVTNGAVKINANDITLENKTIDIDEVYQFTPTVTANATDSKLIWLDTDENIATIDRDGNVMGYSSGAVTVYAIARDSLSTDEVQTLEDLKYDERTIGTDNATLNGILEHAVYKTCTLTVKDEENDKYLRNLHVPAETITDNSVSLLWNRASLVFAPDIDKYIVYQNGTKIAETEQMAYTVNGLNADTEYTFKVEAYKTVTNEDETTESTLVKNAQITVTTKAAPTVINVLDAPYNAAGNGLVTDTYAIQKAIDECPENGVVWLPGDGRIYYSGALFLKSNMTLKVDGVLLGSVDPKDYPSMITRWEGWRKLPQTEEEWANSDIYTQPTAGEYKQIIKHNHYQHSSLITAGTYDEGANSETGPYNVENLTICGEGQINGNGFSLAINEGPNLPSTTDRVIKDQSYRGRTVLIQNSQNVYMKDIMISYSPSWTIHPIYCDNMSIGDIKDISLGNGNVGSGTGVPNQVGHIRNGDGIDPDSCTHMNIYNSYFRCGDDVVTLKSGRNKEGNDLDKPNAYIRVTDCFAHSSIGGYGSGSEVAAGSHDVLFQSLYLESTDCFGIWYKTHPARGGLTENMQARDCTTDGGRSVARVNYDFSLESGKPAQTINRADNEHKRYKTKARYLTYENVGGIGWSGNGRYIYDMYGLRNNSIHADKGMPANISIDHVTIRNANISGNLNCELIKCDDVKIWDIIDGVNWNQTGSSNVTINTDAVPTPEPVDETVLIDDNFNNGSGVWGFTNGSDPSADNLQAASVNSNSLLLTNTTSNNAVTTKGAHQIKTFGTDVAKARKLKLSFIYRNAGGTTNGKSGIFLADKNGKMLFAINGKASNPMKYAVSNGGKTVTEEIQTASSTGEPGYAGTKVGTQGDYIRVDMDIDFTKTSDNVDLVMTKVTTADSLVSYTDGEKLVNTKVTTDAKNLKYFYAINYNGAKATQRVDNFFIQNTAPDLPAVSAEASNIKITTDTATVLMDETPSKTSYSFKATNKTSAVTFDIETEDTGATVKINGSDSKTVTLDGNPITVTVTASDESETNTYTFNIGPSYLLAENFAGAGDDAWGFSGNNNASITATTADAYADIEAGALTLLTKNSNNTSLTRNLSSGISSKDNITVGFDWQSNINTATAYRSGYFSLMDTDGTYLFSIYANGTEGIKYSLGDISGITAKDNYTGLTDIEAFSTKWYHVELTFDFENKTVTGTITDRTTGETKATVSGTITGANLGKLYAYDIFSAAPMSIDNVYIKNNSTDTETASLAAAVTLYGALDTDNYKSDGVTEFNAALTAARTVLNDTTSTQAQIDSAYKALISAAEVLKENAKAENDNMRTVTDENNGWIFAKEKETSTGSGAGILATDKLELSEWESVTLPHTWNAVDGSDGGPGGTPDYDRTKSWYRKQMYVDSSCNGKKLYLEFGGAGTMCELYINGEHVPYANSDIYSLGNTTEYTHRGGFSKFRFDITDYVTCGENNSVSVMVDNSKVPELAPLNGDFNCQGGLYRGVKLIVTDPVHIDMSDYGSDGIYLTFEKVDSVPSDSKITVDSKSTEGEITTYNVSAHNDEECTVIAAVYNADGTLAAVDSKTTTNRSAAVSVRVPENASVKIMAWNSLSEMEPVAPAIDGNAPLDADATVFTLEAKTNIVNDSDEPKTVTIRASLNEPSEFIVPDDDYIKEHLRFKPTDMYTEGGRLVQSFADETITIPAGGSHEYKKQITVTDPHLWNGLDDPYRYEVKLSVSEGGAVLDEKSEYMGFRYYDIPTPTIDANGNISGGGFYLNGKPYTLRGAGKHQDWGRGEDALGYAITEDNMVSDAGLMYELGMNSVRLVHYQHSNEEIDLYDKLGITVWSELGVVDEILSPNDSNYNNFMNVTKAQLTELIKQQYNHPSIVVWSLGNEIRREMTSSFTKAAGDDANSPDLATDYHEQLNTLAKQLDPTRQTTYAAFCLFNRSKDWESDTAAMNLYPYWYTNGMDKWYQNQKSMDGIMTADYNVLVNANSAKPLGISEYGGGGETGFLRPYESDGTVKTGTSAPDAEWSTTYQAYLHEKIYDEIVNGLPWAWCSYVWQLFDSASDKKQGGLPGTNDKGLIKYDHETKKDAFYFYKANWNDIEPFAHVVESTSTNIVRVYSNCDKVQLKINGVNYGEPITDNNPNDEVVDNLGVFMWYNVTIPDGATVTAEGINE